MTLAIRSAKTPMVGTGRTTNERENMSKEQDEAKEVINKIHKSLKQEAFAPIKAKWAAFTGALYDIFMFVKFLVCFSFAALVIAAGVYAAYKGWKSTYMLAHAGLTVAGAAAISLGFSQLWRTVIKRK